MGEGTAGEAPKTPTSGSAKERGGKLKFSGKARARELSSVGPISPWKSRLSRVGEQFLFANPNRRTLSLVGSRALRPHPTLRSSLSVGKSSRWSIGREESQHPCCFREEDWFSFVEHILRV